MAVTLWRKCKSPLSNKIIYLFSFLIEKIINKKGENSIWIARKLSK